MIETEEDGDDDERNGDIFEQDFIKTINLKKVCQGFKQVKSFKELKDNRLFRNLFKNIGETIDLADLINTYEQKDYATSYARDIFLMTKWQEAMEKGGKSTNYIEKQIDAIAHFFVYLQRYRGEFLHDLPFDAIIEVFEVWIIKSGMTPHHIDMYVKIFKQFSQFLEKTGAEDISLGLLDKEDINDLKRVAYEFKTGIWEQNNEDYINWRDRNIIYYL